jgi:exonuclease SbcD
MKILHTSDWHLGRTLYAKKERVLEHKAFLDWLADTIELHGVDVLLIAGDVFDTASPSSISQKLYYDFLVKVKSTCCRNIIIVGGNHDSPSFLNAPKHILASLNISVVGCATENIADELILIKNKENEPELIICGVPFLRERDISRFAEGESYSDRSKRINENIKKHYTEIGQLAVAKRTELGINIPIIATGHLSVMGGTRNEDDGVREAYIGNIEAIGSDIFHAQFDYVALGHYHIASCIQDHIRYCGSPIPMGFGEATQTKCVYLIDFTITKQIDTIPIPVFQKLETIIGDKAYIEHRLNQLKESNESVWVEINYKSDLLFPNLSVWIAEQTKDSLIEVLKLQNKRGLTELLFAYEDADSLDELNEFEVFEKLLHKEAFSDEQIDLLKETYQEIVSELKIGE